METNLNYQNLAPIYEEVANAFAHAKDKIVIAKVDADGAGKSLGQKYEIKGYPSALFLWRLAMGCVNERLNSSEMVLCRW